MVLFLFIQGVVGNGNVFLIFKGGPCCLHVCKFVRMPEIKKQLYLPKADKSYQNANGVFKNAIPDGHKLHSPHVPGCSGQIGRLQNI